MNFQDKLKEKTGRAEEVIRKYLPEEKGFAKNMAQAMNYSMLAGGKRLRPLLMDCLLYTSGKSPICSKL